MAKKRTVSKAKSQPESVLAYKECKTLAFISLDPPENVEIKDAYYYSLGLELAVDLVNGFVRAQIAIDCTSTLETERAASKEDDVLLFSMLTEHIFAVTNLNGLLQKEDAAFEIPLWLEVSISSVSVGTARGMLFAKLADTRYKSFVLPIFALKDLLPDKRATTVPVHGI